MSDKPKAIKLFSEKQRDNAISIIKGLTLNTEKPYEVVIGLWSKRRNSEQNRLMWADLRDVSQQVFVDGRKFSSEVWHEYFKREHLPEKFETGITKAGYKKWDYTPVGERVLIGSTTNLTTKGFAEYLLAVQAEAQTEYGVRFTTEDI